MAQVPDDEISSVQQDALPGRAIPRISDDATPAEFGAGLGQGLEQAGENLGQVQDRAGFHQSQLNADYQARQDKANQMAVRVKSANAMTDISQIVDQLRFGKDQNDPDAAYKQTGKNLVTLPDDYSSKLDDAVAQRLKGETPEVQSALAEHVASVKDSFKLDLYRYQHEQSNREATEAFTNAASQAIQDGYKNYRDPEQAGRSRDMIIGAGRSLAELGGKEAVKAYNETGFKQDMDKLHTSDVNAFLADGNISGAKKYLDKWQGDLSDGIVKERLENQIRAAGDRIEAKTKDVSRDRINDQVACYKAGLTGCEGLAHAGDYQTVHKNDAQRYMDLTQKFAAAGQAEKEFDNMTAEQGRDHLMSTAPTKGLPGIQGDMEAQQLMERAYNSSQRRRQEDGANFAITTGKGWNPIDWTDPKGAASELDKRANTQDQISKQIGVRVPLLSRIEAQQLGDSLSRDNAQGKYAKLSALHDVVPDGETYASVMTQIMPHSPVSAIVGQKIGTPNNWSMPSYYDPKFAPDPKDAMTVLKGEEKLNPTRGKGIETEEKGGYKGGFPMPSDDQQAGLQAAFGRFSTDLFNGRAQLADAHYSAFRDAYAQIASDAGKYDGNYDETLATKAFQAAVGKPITYNGHYVIPPKGMDPSKFEGNVQRAVAETLKAHGASAEYIHGLGNQFALKELGAVGSGRYALTSGGMPASIPGRPNDQLVVDIGGNRFGPTP